MADITEYGSFNTSWCPGCGNFPILESVKKSLVDLGLKPQDVFMVSGIGQAAKLPHYLNCNMYNGLHGRALSPAQAAKLALPELTVVVNSGDGCSYGEGGNHFLAAIRRNVDITLLAHDNQIYGQTKGQASPTTLAGQKTKAQPGGVNNQPFNPIAVAVAMKAGFVARAFSGMQEHLQEMIKLAIKHKGFSLVDILQPCVSFNKVNTHGWYKERVRELGDEHDPRDWDQAMQVAQEFGEAIPIGVIYENDLPDLGAKIPAVQKGALYKQAVDMDVLAEIMEGYA